jgi:hypothetical protein
MVSPRTASTLVLASVLLAGAACNGDDPPSTSAPSSTATTTTAATDPEATSTTTVPASETRLTPQGYGNLRLGMTLNQATVARLVTDTRPGCELGGPGEIVGTIAGTENGAAYFDDDVLAGINLRKEMTAEGIGPGSTLDEAKKAYGTGGYSLKVDDSPQEVFGISIASVTRNGQAAYQFDIDGDKVQSLWVPTIRFCD